MPDQQMQDIKHAIVIALREDRARDDITSEACLPEDVVAKAEIVVHQRAKLAGLAFVPWVFEVVDPEVRCEIFYEDGSDAEPGTIVARVKGRARSLLSAERVAMNIVQHASGVATLTAECVKEVKEYSCDILDTRKTLPGLRALQKYAVKVGGGKNQCCHLQEAFLIKNNHMKVLKRYHESPISMAIAKARAMQPLSKVEIEVEDLDMLYEALEAKADLILLDNMPIELMKKCVIITAGRAYLEASGAMQKDRLRETAMAGLNGISIGALTQSAAAVDISMRIIS